MKNLENKIIDIQRDWELLLDYEESIVIPSVRLNAEEKVDEDVFELVIDFMEQKELIEFEKELYTILLNLEIEIEKDY